MWNESSICHRSNAKAKPKLFAGLINMLKINNCWDHSMTNGLLPSTRRIKKWSSSVYMNHTQPFFIFYILYFCLYFIKDHNQTPSIEKATGAGKTNNNPTYNTVSSRPINIHTFSSCFILKKLNTLITRMKETIPASVWEYYPPSITCEVYRIT